MTIAPDGRVVQRFKVGRVSWAATNERLQVETDPASRDHDAGQIASVILDLLKHTPVNGVGNNFDFEPGDLAAGVERLLRMPLLDALSARGTVPMGTDLEFKLQRTDALLTLTFHMAPNLTGIHMNFHRDAKDAEEASKFAKRWSTDRDEAEAVIKELEEVA